LSWRTTAKSIINGSLRPFGVELHALPSATQVTRRTVKEYLALCDPKILQIASGPHYAAECYRNWLNSDVENPQCHERGVYSIYMDLNHNFPLPTGSFDYIFSQQGIEHFTYNRGVQILRECYRVLKPGGRVRIETPNIAYFIDNYRANDKPVAEAVHEPAREIDAPPTHLTALNMIVRHWDHLYVYDVETLANLCRECGFADVREVEMGRTDIVAFQAAIAFNPGSDPYYMECSFALEMERPRVAGRSDASRH
jgi:predicted SAM-dependent methyltransferase